MGIFPVRDENLPIHASSRPDLGKPIKKGEGSVTDGVELRFELVGLSVEGVSSALLAEAAPEDRNGAQ
jgi:hypothetical protein